MNTNALVSKARELIDIPNSRYKHFTFILTEGGWVVSRGINNKKKTHPLAKKYNHRFFSTHSEINAIAKFPYPLKDLNDFCIVNIRLNRRGQLRLAKPCLCCQEMLRAFGARKIWYSTSEGVFEVMKL